MVFTIGDINVGATHLSLISTTAKAFVCVMPQAGTINDINFYVDSFVSGSGGDVCVSLYNSLLAREFHDTVTVPDGAAGWYTTINAGIFHANGDTVYLGLKGMSGIIGDLHGSAVVPEQHFNDNGLVAANHCPNPFVKDAHSHYTYGIYANCTEVSSAMLRRLLVGVGL